MLKHFGSILLMLGSALVAQAQIPFPPQSATSTDSVGFFFRAPGAMTILGMRVADAPANSVQDLLLQTNAADPVTGGTGTPVDAYRIGNLPSGQVGQCNVHVAAGEPIAVLGWAQGTGATVATGAVVQSSIGGTGVTLQSIRMNGRTGFSGPINYVAAPDLGRIEVYYTTDPAPMVPFPQPATYTMNGFWQGVGFQAPVSMIVKGVRVVDADGDGVETLALDILPGAPSISTPATGTRQLFASNVPSYQIVPCYVPLHAGEWLGCFGGASQTRRVSLAFGDTIPTTIGGHPATLQTLMVNGNLAGSTGALPCQANPWGFMPCFEIYYELPTTFASVTPIGIGCGGASRSFYDQMPPTAFPLANHAAKLVPSSGGYQVVAGPAFVPPPAGAQVLALGDDAETTVQLSSAFAFPGGSTSSLVVCSNGFVSAAAGNGIHWIPDSTVWCNSAQARWGDWHDFNPTASGSGHIQFHESGTVSYVTWNGVFSFNGYLPNWFQLQFDRANGSVTYAWLGMSGQGLDHLVGYAAGGPSLELGNLDLLARLGTQVTQPNERGQLHLAVSAMPLLGTTVQLVTQQRSGAPGLHVRMLGFQPVPSGAGDLAAYGAPGCSIWVSPLATDVSFAPAGSTTFAQPFALPNDLGLIGVHLLAQTAMQEGLSNALGFEFTNGLDLRLDYF